MDPSNASLISNHPSETERLAKLLAPFCLGGQAVLLDGPIGAGKSLFARTLITELLDEPEDIPSPTFTLVQVYHSQNLEIWHSDLYRITNPNEVFELGLDDAFDTSLCIIEWPDRLGDFKPSSFIEISFENMAEETQRRISLSSQSPHWAQFIRGLDAG